MPPQIEYSLDAFLAERSQVLEKARQMHAMGIKQAADAKRAKQSAVDATETEAESKRKKKGPSKPRWMLLYEAKFESYAKLLGE